ncbi:hypothetical protein [Maribellus sediminis]|uniref:hypothetical protein n=1 Tax=Maribellus sediminis TaxID=2696285 RepID=UPI00142F8089|nr:hypothetical protein [Maribellus sediminis]
MLNSAQGIHFTRPAFSSAPDPPNTKTRNRLRSAPPCLAELPCIPALAFSQLVTNNLTGSLRYFSSAPAHSPDRLQRSLNPFAHSRETVACFAVTGKGAFWHRTKRAILLFHSSPALFFSRPQIRLTGINELTGGKTKKKPKIAGLPTNPTLGKMQDQDECPGLLILQVYLAVITGSVAILHFIHGRQFHWFLFFFSLFSFLLRESYFTI